MFSSKSPKVPSKKASKSPQEQICMVDCGCQPSCTCSAHSPGGTRQCAPQQKKNVIDMEKHGFDNLAFESQSELHPQPLTRSSATFKLLAHTNALHAQTIEERISNLNGITSVSLSLPSSLAKVEYDTSVITTKEIILELQTMGIAVESAVHIRVDGMHCQSCVHSIEGHIGPSFGVSHIKVSLQDEVALIVYQPLLVTRQELVDRIEDMGFRPTLLADDPSGQDISFWQGDILNSSFQTVAIWIEGMTCHSCVQSIEGRISQMAGVQSIAVSLKEEKAMITFDPSLTDPEQLRAAIEDMGFDASLEEFAKNVQSHEKSSPGPCDLTRLQSCNKVVVSNGTGLQGTSQSEIKAQKCFICITGMTCASCVANIEKNLLKQTGILTVLVSLMAGKAEVKYESEVINAVAVTRLIEDLGFGAKLIEDNAVTHGNLDLTITGMTCASCIHNIESKLSSTKGILEASVALATQKAKVHFDPEVLGARDIIKIIQVMITAYLSPPLQLIFDTAGYLDSIYHSRALVLGPV